MSQATIQDPTWYVAIEKFFGNEYYSFIGAGGESYRSYKEIAEKHGIDIIAERFSVTDQQINRITGFDSRDNRTLPNLLGGLVLRLRSGESFDVQAELDKFCSSD